jgi:5-bromo-4-chloroindolyl phosphate hydrolysis protein
MSEPENNGWHLDRKVPIVLIFAIILQTAGIIWWAATLSVRLDVLESQFEARSSIPERITRMETKLDTNLEYIRRSLDEQRQWFQRLKDSLDQERRAQ